MRNLTNSIFLLLAYLFLVLGLAQIRYFETHILYFQAAFFVSMTFAVFAGLVPFSRFRMPLYAFLAFWAIIYILIWQFYWRSLASPPDPSEVAIQFKKYFRPNFQISTLYRICTEELARGLQRMLLQLSQSLLFYVLFTVILTRHIDKLKTYFYKTTFTSGYSTTL